MTGKATIVKFQHILTVVYNLKARRNSVSSSKWILNLHYRPDASVGISASLIIVPWFSKQGID